MSKLTLTDLNKITKTTWVCLIATILALGFAAYMGASVTVDVSLEGRLSAIEQQIEQELNSSFYGLQKGYSYIISQVGSYVCLQNGTTGKLDDYSTIHQNVFDWAFGNITTGSVYVKAADYDSVSITVNSDEMLILEAGVSGVAPTINTGAYCLRYSSGYAWFDMPISLTNHEIQYAAFHTGVSAPSNPITGQWWYDTNVDVYDLKIYNSTHWEIFAGGIQGEQGEAGEGGYGDYNFIVYKNSSTSNYQYRDWQGQLQGTNADAHTIVNAAIDDLPVGRDHMGTVVLKDEITITSSILLDSYTRLVIKGELKAGSSGFDMIKFSSTTQYLVEICGGGIINGDDKAVDGIHLQGSSQPSWRSFIHDLTIHHCEENGIWTEGGCRLIAANLYIYYCDLDGIHIDSYDCKIINVVVGEAGVHGIHNDSTNNHFTGCKCYGSGENGFHLNGARAGVTNCIAQENDKHGFHIDQKDQTLTGCIADRNSMESSGTYHGFYVVGDNILLTGCEAMAFKSPYYTDDGIHIASMASNVRINGFTVDGNILGMDIYVHSSASDISISGIDGEYQTDTGTWSTPSTTKVSAFEGRVVYQYNADQTPNTRICVYAGGAWRYIS